MIFTQRTELKRIVVGLFFETWGGTDQMTDNPCQAELPNSNKRVRRHLVRGVTEKVVWREGRVLLCKLDINVKGTECSGYEWRYATAIPVGKYFYFYLSYPCPWMFLM